MNKKKATGEGLPRHILCDNCGKTVAYITGRLNIELADIINNNTRYVANTEIYCLACLEEKLNKEVTK